MAVVSSCCEAWPWVAQRTPPAPPQPPLPPGSIRGGGASLGRVGSAPACRGRPCRGRSQVNMAYIGGATHVLQGPAQRAATAKAGATPQRRPRFGLRGASRA